MLLHVRSRKKLAIHNPSILQRYPQLGGNTSESLVTKIQTWSSLGAWNKSLQCLRHKARARSQTQHLFSIPMIPAGNVRDTKSIKSKWRNWEANKPGNQTLINYHKLSSANCFSSTYMLMMHGYIHTLPLCLLQE